ncbi:MAG: hypothetical protein V2I67_19725 [Thermoanaerobaculales bacterium]|nr:hypothetical protein [Thermoanaerobaculales bacterium]
MKNTKTITVLVATVTLISLSALSAELEPLTVSPGATERFTGVEVRCPTFSWQAVPGTVGYEVVVYQLPLQTELAAWSLDQAVEVLFVELPVGVTAWTPSLERGLARGAEHVWFVRGVMGEDEATQWSKARFFRVAGGFSSGTGTGTGTDTVTATATATATATVTATVTDPAIATATATGPSAMADSVGETKTRDVSTAMAAIRGEMPDVTGETYGVVGTSNSLEGGGLAGVNTTEGPDLVLDGAANGRTDAYLFDWGLDRSSPGVEVFGFTNEEGGTIDLYVGGDVHARSLFGDGTEVTEVDAASLDGMDGSFYLDWGNLAAVPGDIADGDNDTLMDVAPFCEQWQVPKWDGSQWICYWDTDVLLGLSCSAGEVAKWDGANWNCAPDIDTNTTYSAGTGMQLVGTEFRAMGAGYAKVVVVAASGGDFTSIQAAIDSITLASGSNPYLVWVAPGLYNETVTMKSHVHVQGAGQDVTTIWSSVGNSSPPPSQATLMLASETSVRDLTVSNVGTDTWNVAIMGSAGVADVVLADVSVFAQGSSGTNNWAIVSTGGATEIAMENVTAESGGGSEFNFGLKNDLGATASITGGSFTGDGGTWALGILNSGSGSTVVATDVNGLGVAADDDSSGLYNGTGATAVLRGGSFVASGGDVATGVSCVGSGSTLDASGITATGENGSGDNLGLFVSAAGAATLRAGLFSARGGTFAIGISSEGLGTILEAIGVSATGEDAVSDNYGMLNDSGALAKLRGGWFMAEGGEYPHGIKNIGMNSTVDATNVTASAVGGSMLSLGFVADSLSESFLHGGSFSINRSGGPGYGISASGNLILEIVNVVADGSPAVRVSDGIASISHSLVVGGVGEVGNSFVECFVVCRESFNNPLFFECPPPPTAQ